MGFFEDIIKEGLKSAVKGYVEGKMIGNSIRDAGEKIIQKIGDQEHYSQQFPYEERKLITGNSRRNELEERDINDWILYGGEGKAISEHRRKEMYEDLERAKRESKFIEMGAITSDEWLEMKNRTVGTYNCFHKCFDFSCSASKDFSCRYMVCMDVLDYSWSDGHYYPTGKILRVCEMHFDEYYERLRRAYLAGQASEETMRYYTAMQNSKRR